MMSESSTTSIIKNDDDLISNNNKSISSGDSSTNNNQNYTLTINASNDSTLETYLEHARNGNLNLIKDLIETDKSFNVNYRGKHKRFYGWSALHIACYFNQIEIVKYLLKHQDINVNICNYENDTPLHKASLASRYEIVEMLVTNNADINMKNNEGLKPKDLTVDLSIKKLLQAAEKTESYNLQKALFEAVLNNDLDAINKLCQSKIFDINCVDTFGNTALHIAANQNQTQAAILLIQKGINTLLKNNQNLTALDLAKTKDMKEIIGYVTSSNRRNYEGYLLKKRKFLGYKEYYVVLKNGSIYYYQSKKDAGFEQNCRGKYFLNNAFIREYPNTGQHDFSSFSWTIHYTNGRKHTLCSANPIKKKMVNSISDQIKHQRSFHSNLSNLSSNSSSANLNGINNSLNSNNNNNNSSNSLSNGANNTKSQLNPIERKKKWIDAIKEHIAYSDSHIQINDNQTIMPMESLQQNLNILKLDEEKLNFLLIQIEQQLAIVNNLNQQSTQTNIFQIITTYKSNFDNLRSQIKVYIDDANKCINLHEQRDSLLKQQLTESRLKCDLLEQSLRVLAQENHDLEVSKLQLPVNEERGHSNTNDQQTATNSNMNKINEDDDDSYEEFYDIPDDPLTDEETETKSNASLDGENAASPASNYGSTNDLNNSSKSINQNNKTSKLSTSQQQLAVVKNNQIEKKKSINSLILVNEVDAHGWRIRLPAKMIDRSQISIWSILKQSIGKELSRIAMPAAWCEPLSFLQRITENVAHCQLLNKAADPELSSDSLRRFEYVCAFAVSCISFNHNRLSKPFNPILGETYELSRDDMGFKIVCEQVSHHPPISAFHSESSDNGNSWKFYGSINPKIKFWGKSIEVTPKGIGTLELNKFNEVYTWHAVTCCIHNIIVGKLWFEYYGTMEITCKQNGYRAIINFKPYSWSNKELNKVDGFIYDKKKNKVKALYGYWTHCLYSCDPEKYESYIRHNKPLPMVHVDEYFNEINLPNPGDSLKNVHSASSLLDENNKNNENDSQLADDTQRKLHLNKRGSSFEPSPSAVSLPINSSYDLTDVFEIWRAPPLPPYSNDYYNFNYFTMCLNEMKDEFKNKLAPTDSRLRQDIRQLELGNLDGAGEDKSRLEEKQREHRRNRKEEYRPRWFYSTKHPLTQEETWVFNNKYWLRDFSDSPDLY